MNRLNDGDDFKQLSGAKVLRVDFPNAPGVRDTVEIVFADGRRLVLYLDGDCCSCSYFADVQQFVELVNAVVYQIEERDGASREGLPEREDYSEVSWHFLVFTTDKGHVTIDWRNDSNGYYDGSLHASIEQPK